MYSIVVERNSSGDAKKSSNAYVIDSIKLNADAKIKRMHSCICNSSSVSINSSTFLFYTTFYIFIIIIFFYVVTAIIKSYCN